MGPRGQNGPYLDIKQIRPKIKIKNKGNMGGGDIHARFVEMLTHVKFYNDYDFIITNIKILRTVLLYEICHRNVFS